MGAFDAFAWHRVTLKVSASGEVLAAQIMFCKAASMCLQATRGLLRRCCRGGLAHMCLHTRAQQRERRRRASCNAGRCFVSAPIASGRCWP